MNWEAIGAVGEILGAIGVIATLGYLAVQIRQNTKSTRQAAARSTVDTVNRLNLVLVERPEIVDLVVRGSVDREKLGFNDSFRFHMFMMSTFILYQEGYLNSKQSELDPHLWLVLETHMLQWLQSPSLVSWWEENRHRFSSGFVKHVDAGRSSEASESRPSHSRVTSAVAQQGAAADEPQRG